MPPNQRNPTDPREWIRRARSNLARAKANRQLPDVVLEDLCFDAQQAVEKAFKALLVSRQHPFPRTHAIAELLGLVEQSGIGVPEAVREAAELTDYAVEARYPGVYEDVVESEYHRAIDLADRVVAWAVRLLDAALRQEAEAVATNEGAETPGADSRGDAEPLKADE